MSPNFLKFVQGVLEKLHLHEADKKDPAKSDNAVPLLSDKNLIFKKDTRTDAEKKAATLSEEVREISKRPKEQEGSSLYQPKDKL